MNKQKRLRIFAGPNGSGKSTIINIVKNVGVDMGIYVNADEIKKDFENNGFLDFELFTLLVQEDEYKDDYKESSFFDSERYDEIDSSVKVEDNKVYCTKVNLYDLISTYTADFIRTKLLDEGKKFTFETVMSHHSKIEFIQKAHDYGYKTYLYFVSLEDPELNKERVKARVMLNGHSVPDDKIVSRYYRTMNLLFEILKVVDKAFFFDNSGSESVYFAKYEDGEINLFSQDDVPQWFYSYVIEKLS